MRTYLLLLLVAGCCLYYPVLPTFRRDVAQAYAALPDGLDYNLHVKPILSDKCFACHGPDKAKQKAGLATGYPRIRLRPPAESPGKVAIDPGSLKGSELFQPHPVFRPRVPDAYAYLSPEPYGPAKKPC